MESHLCALGGSWMIGRVLCWDVAKDCLASHLVSSSNVVNGSSQEDADDEETCKGEGLGKCDNGQEDNGLDEGDEECDDDSEFSDGELDEGVDEDNGEDYEDELVNELYGISF
ncbi:hypothetical protein BDR05DRAFT_947929 [Suillus weaverae]|nr:hypothetical protein BDR05DRAFT_947929 [Suillus weaverae]